MHSSTSVVRRRVRDIMSPVPARATPSQSLAEALNAMAGARAPCILIADAEDKPVGILTEQDVVRRAVWRTAPGEPVTRMASAPVITVPTDEPLLRALAIMRRHNLRRMPVVHQDGRLAGLLELHVLLWSLSGPASRIMDMMVADDSVEGLAAIKKAEVDLAAALLADHVPGPDIQLLLSEINLDLHRRALSHAILEMELNGWGPPPVAFSLILMGSHGRAENFLAPDQDNAMVLADYPDAEHDRVNAWFMPLTDRFTRLLDRVGFTLCKGNVMATNPVWRKRISEWRDQVALWVGRHTEQRLLLSDILLDFRHAAGDERLSINLRDAFMDAIRRRPRFVRELYSIEQDHRVALGWFGGLAKERDERNRPGYINLKLHGTLPLVEAVRLMSLKSALPLAGSTLDRLDALAAAKVIDAHSHDYLTHGYALMSKLLLAAQIETARQNQEPNDFVADASLTRRERDQLVACLREIETLRAGLKMELADVGI